METRLSNIFKTTNVTNLTKVIQEISNGVLQVTSIYFLKAVEYYFGYISGKVAKPHFLETPQKSLKTRQHSYQ